MVQVLWFQGWVHSQANSILRNDGEIGEMRGTGGMGGMRGIGGMGGIGGIKLDFL